MLKFWVYTVWIKYLEISKIFYLNSHLKHRNYSNLINLHCINPKGKLFKGKINCSEALVKLLVLNTGLLHEFIIILRFLLLSKQKFDEEETLHNAERNHFKDSGSADSFLSWSFKSEISSNNSSDSSLGKFMKKKEIHKESERKRARDDIEELDSTENEKLSCWRSHSVQVANVSDCPMDDMERIRIVSCLICTGNNSIGN